MKFTAPRHWVGQTCVIMAGGPSLLQQDFSLIDKYRPAVITINDSWRVRPYANILYFCDREWWHNQWASNPVSLDGSENFRAMRYKGFWVKGGEPLPEYPEVRLIEFTGQEGLETNPAGLRHGSNSTYASINLAYHYGVKKIILLGVEMQPVNGRTHWHNEKRLNSFPDVLKTIMLPLFAHLVDPLEKAGVEVINATPGSALTCWRYLPLEDALRA